MNATCGRISDLLRLVGSGYERYEDVSKLPGRLVDAAIEISYDPNPVGHLQRQT